MLPINSGLHVSTNRAEALHVSSLNMKKLIAQQTLGFGHFIVPGHVPGHVQGHKIMQKVPSQGILEA